MHLVRLKRLGIVRLSQNRRSLLYHRALQILPFVLVLTIFSTLTLITLRQSPRQSWRFPINSGGGLSGVMYKYQQHLKQKTDQQFKIEPFLQKDAPSVEKSARELLSSVQQAAISVQKDNDTEVYTVQLPPCHLDPDTLLGRLNISLVAPSWDDEIANVSFGGEWQPTQCESQHLVAVVIPFRDRASHLITLLHHLHPILQRQLLHYKIFVVEQAGNGTFNKGVLMNAGFKLILQHHAYPGAVIFHCFIFHDVDLLLEDDRNLHSCPPMPRHLSVAVDELGYRLPYKHLAGGVFALRTEHFLQVNGYSNLFWGWGGEDDDMGLRVLQVGLQITRPPPQIGRYTMIKHHKQVPLADVIKKKLLRTSRKRWRLDGLNTLKFTHLETRAEKYYTKLVISVGTPPSKIVQLQAVFEKNRQLKKRPLPPYRPPNLHIRAKQPTLPT
uniref:Beta-1,4-N-acetylgalactosaminyltransferase n=1 Tax=Cacopsylla melanoneura TaxID=428564 RepID=A0A8D8UQ01_9HEMI